MKKTLPLLTFSLLYLALAACSSPAAASGLVEPEKAPVSDLAAPEKAPVKSGREVCPVTQPPRQPFVPPKPWPETYPYEGRVWYGDAGLWTAIPEDGEWAQLRHGDKFWMWSQDFDVEEDTTPDTVVTGRRLDGASPELRNEGATNGYHPDFDWAMLTGVTVDSPGCWELTVEYNGHTLAFVVWVPEN